MRGMLWFLIDFVGNLKFFVRVYGSACVFLGDGLQVWVFLGKFSCDKGNGLLLDFYEKFMYFALSCLQILG